MPCSCHLFGYRTGNGTEDPGSGRDCSKPTDLSGARQFQKWQEAIHSGKTVGIGDFYIAKIDDFYVVELSQGKKAN